MPSSPLRAETTFLRGFTKSYFSAIAFNPIAENEMREQGVSLTEVNHVLLIAAVVSSEKEEANGAVWRAQGNTLDGDCLTITIEVSVGEYDLCITGVSKLPRSQA